MISSFSSERAKNMSMGLTGVRQFPGNLGFLLEPKDIASKIPGLLCSSHLDSFDPLLRQTKTFFAALSTLWCAPKPGTAGARNGNFDMFDINKTA